MMLGLALALPAVRRPGSNPNLLTFPTQFDNAAWAKTALTVTADQAVAPDGTTTMERAVPTATTGDHYMRRNTVGQLTNTTYTLSVYAKPNGYNFIDLRPLAITGAPRAVFNVATGAVVSTGAGISSSRIEAAANGAYRCIITFTTGGTISPGDQIDVSVWSASTATGFTGDGTSGVHLWGAKLEVGSTATAFP